MALKDTLKKAHFDTSVRPQNDFYTYAGGGWLVRNPIPKEEMRWGTFEVLVRENQQKLLSLVKGLEKKHPAAGSPGKTVRNFWRSGMNVKARAKLGFQPLAPYIKAINATSSVESLVDTLAKLHKDGFSGIWASGIGIDDKRSDRQELIFWQDGLSLPDRDFYVKDTVEYKNIRAALVSHIERILIIYGTTKKEAARAAQNILSLETKIARVSRTQVELRDPHRQYNPHTLGQLSKRAPSVNWKRYLAGIGAKTNKVIIGQPEFIEKVDTLIGKTSLSVWKEYLTWHTILDASPFLFEKLAQAQFDFYGTLLNGVPKMRPLWRRIISTIDSHIPDALGQLYIAAYFPKEAKRRMDALVVNITHACRERIENLEWMTPRTKRFALKKLAAIRPKIGHPKRFLSYSGVAIKSDDFFGNVVRTNRYYHAREMRKIGKKPDPDEWHMTPSTVNAYFNANRNEIVFPAGILQPPFFDKDADDALNYGAIGAVIGHEITHAFDDEGRKFDEKGNLKDWWTKKDEGEFKKRAEVLRKQYDAFEVLPKHFVNGELTLGENIADLGGVLIAYSAWQKTTQSKQNKPIGGFTPAQRFFMGFAFAECGAIRDEALKKRLITDPHSPSPCRVNGPLPHVDAFYEAFGVGKHDKLYLPESKRARIW